MKVNGQDCRRGKEKEIGQRTQQPYERKSMKILLIQGVNFLRKVRPAQRPCKFIPKGFFTVSRTCFCKLDLPATKIIKQTHVRLDQHRESARANDEIGVDEWKTQMLHNVCDLYPKSAHGPNVF